MTATFVVALIGWLLPQSQMEGWGFRVPFLLGAALGLATLYLRRTLEDSTVFHDDVQEQGTTSRFPLMECLVRHWRALFLVVGLLMMQAIGGYVYIIYFPTYLHGLDTISESAAYGLSLIGPAVWVLSSPPFAALSDRVGRRPLLISSLVFLAVITFPAFNLMGSGGVTLVAVGYLILVLGTSALIAPSAAYLAEAFPSEVRYTATGTGFALATTLFGGTAPLLAAYFVSTLEQEWLLSTYCVLGALVSLTCVVFFMPESAHTTLAARDQTPYDTSPSGGPSEEHLDRAPSAATEGDR